jgi:hypothetical protein
MIFHEFSEDFVLAFELFLEKGDPLLLEVRCPLGAAFERGGAVLEELLLPSVEQRGVDAVPVAEVGDRCVLQEGEPEDRELLPRGEPLPRVLGYGIASARYCSLFERGITPFPSEVKQSETHGILAVWRTVVMKRPRLAARRCALTDASRAAYLPVTPPSPGSVREPGTGPRGRGDPSPPAPSPRRSV